MSNSMKSYNPAAAAAAEEFLNDGDISKQTTRRSESLRLSNVDQRILIQEGAEISGASLEIFRHMKEIEVLVHRVVICAPTFSAQNPRVVALINDWNTFRDSEWSNMAFLSVQDNPLGA